ncbi:MAG TPA: glycoside hydrolase family 44 protein [Prolixibacteraceae bacterium]|nr:glycoside hydrolase family 44 protein [Prolixibacteraceae bacterium]HPS11954.1 glycoside hydrolase family 44 protein [Prolixibacteraceae bacterium]
MRKYPFLSCILLISSVAFSQPVSISIDASQNRKAVSPYIYGKNNSLSDDPTNPLKADEWKRLKDSGIKLFRENSGNNATKYNWRLKLTSAPDWYNNVYSADWDYEARSLQDHIPGAKGMYAFQLIGKTAASNQYNFNDWGYNNSQWWPGVAQNLAGNGGVNTDWNATNALVEGNTSLYLKEWPADSTVAILDNWFGTGSGSLNLDKSSFQYWNMDNEPEIWEGTHDDVMPHQCTAEEFMQKYFAVAKKARAKYPAIKLVGFVPCSEWYWYAYPNGKGDSGKISYGGKGYTWVEFFIKRIAEEQKATGIRLLDVIDLHTYLDAGSVDELLQAHRVFYDETYDYPGANGVKLLGKSGWDNSLTKEYIFKRINNWLTEYLGENHGVTIGTTESGWDSFNQMPLALNYASTLGVFADNGVELFTPWFWSPSYWEVVHLFSKYSKSISVLSQSGDDHFLSAYTTVNTGNDSMTVVLVNRYATPKEVKIAVSNFAITDGVYPAYTLANLPGDNSTETFVSDTENALKPSNVAAFNNTITMTVPGYSITSVVLRAGAAAGNYLALSSSAVELESTSSDVSVSVYSNVSWRVSCDQSWLKLSAVSGTNNGIITLSAEANTLSESRSATVTFSGAGVENQTFVVTQKAPVLYPHDNLIIYNDNQTLIQGTWSSDGTLAQVTGGAYEGSKHYQFSYSFSNWWAGYGLNLTNWAGNGSGYDFSLYDSLKFACSLTGSVTVSFSLADADNSTYSDGVEVTGVNAGYREYSIPISLFTGINPNDVGEIMVNISGSESSGSGTFCIDNIRLIAKGNQVTGTDPVSQTQKPSPLFWLQNSPNPFSSSTAICFVAPEAGHYLLRVFDFSGRLVSVLQDSSLQPGMQNIPWNGTSSGGQRVSCGIYFCQLMDEKGNFKTLKMIYR